MEQPMNAVRQLLLALLALHDKRICSYANTTHEPHRGRDS